MKRMIACAAAALLMTATGAFAQAAMSPGATTPKSAAPKAAAPQAGTEEMKTDTGAKADAKPKAHRRMAKNEAALNASEAETTKQLNREQAELAQQPR